MIVDSDKTNGTSIRDMIPLAYSGLIGRFAVSLCLVISLTCISIEEKRLP